MKLFVYGTLRKGGRLAKSLPENRPIRLCCISGIRLYNLGPFPAAVLTGNTDDKAMGEVQDYKGILSEAKWEALLEYLDIIESVSSGLYQRARISTPYGDAIIYVANRELWFDEHLKEQKSKRKSVPIITDWAQVDFAVASQLDTLKEEKIHVALRSAEQEN